MRYLLYDFDFVLNQQDFFSHKVADDNGISRDVVNRFFQGPYQECLAGKADPKIVLAKYMQSWGWTGTAEELIHFWHQYEDVLDESMIAHIKSLHAQDIPFAIATNQDIYRTEYIKKRLERISFPFDRFYSSSAIGAYKPDPAFFAYIYMDLSTQYSLKKNDIFFIDDTKKHVESAKKFGFQAHHFTGIDDYKKAVEQFLKKQ